MLGLLIEETRRRLRPARISPGDRIVSTIDRRAPTSEIPRSPPGIVTGMEAPSPSREMTGSRPVMSDKAAAREEAALTCVSERPAGWERAEVPFDKTSPISGPTNCSQVRTESIDSKAP